MIPLPINEETSDKFPINDIFVTQSGKALEKTTEKTTESIAENIVENIVENLSAMRGSIVKIIWKNPRATAQSISKEVGIAPRNVQEHLKYLQEAGILRRIGPDKGGHTANPIPPPMPGNSIASSMNTNKRIRWKTDK